MEIIYLDGKHYIDREDIVSAIGFFDGLHIGHLELVKEVKRVSEEKNLKSALMTFDHYPSYVLGFAKSEEWLMSMNDRIELLKESGLDYLFIIVFNKDVASLSCHQFIEDYIIKNNIKHVVCGFDFRFGNKNLGDTQTLKQCPHISVSVIEEVLYNNEKISSSRIRKELDAGHIREVNTLLGRPYTITGKVIQGRQIGRKIGFPTANIDYSNYHLPGLGVYAIKVLYKDHYYIGMCNIGYNPTFTSLNIPSLEIHLFDFNEDLYNENIKVYFYDFIRQEIRFNSKEELISQLSKDASAIRQLFKTQF